MKISCIIPTYNRKSMVGEAIKSVQTQQGCDVEIVVVDDGSTDGTADFIKEHFQGVRFVRVNCVGPGMARNAGVEAACGEVLMFLDSDDVWLPHHGRILYEIISSGFEVAYGTTLTKDQLADREFLIPDKGHGIKGDCFDALARWCFMVPSSLAVTRRAYEKIGGFGSEKFGEDWIFFMQLAEKFRFGFAGPQPITLRTLHRESLCCLHSGGSIVKVMRNINGIVLQSKKRVQQSRMDLKHREKWIMENSDNWQSVQDCYCAMKKEGFV